MPRTRSLLLAALILAPLPFAAQAAAAPAPASQVVTAGDETSLLRITTLNISADGQTKVEPDQATITFGVQTQEKTAAEAMAANRTKMTATLAALKAAGIAAKDVQTSNLNLNGQYTYEPNQQPKLTGYQAVNQVTVIVRDLAKLGVTVDAVTGAGVNQINGIEFGLSDPKPYEDEARKQAVKALAARAQLYADAAGLKLGRLINLSEAGGYQPAPVRVMAFADARVKMAAPNTPVEPGQLTVRIDVSAVYELVK